MGVLSGRGRLMSVFVSSLLESLGGFKGIEKYGRRTLAILIQAGSSNLGSSEPPERYRTQDVM